MMLPRADAAFISVMKKGFVRKIVALVIVLNFVQLAYFVLHKAPDQQQQQQQQQEQEQQESRSRGGLIEQDQPIVLKGWPQGPSYTPWLLDPKRNLAHSCEAFFGHGFTELHRIIENPVHQGGSFRCYHSDTLQTSVCEGTKMVLHPSRISMAVGGEDIDAVIGRGEDEEMPQYKPGAFEIQVREDVAGRPILDGAQLDAVLTRGQVHRHTMRALLESTRTVSSKDVTCSEVVSRPTLFVTRFEYANLFHTVTDWYSSYASSRVVGLKERPMVVFLDGHCKSPMDDGWEAFFSDVKYVKHFSDSVCFNHAVFVPLGYETVLFKCLTTGLPCSGSSPAELDSSRTARLREFGEVFSASFSNTTLTQVTDPRSGPKDIQILFIRREDYLAHPRHSGKPESRLTNEADLYNILVEWARKTSRFQRKVTIFNGLFAHMKLGEQIKAVQSSSIILGVHGAGLTHIVFAKPDSVVLEILSPLFMRPHYQFISQWMGIEYHSIIMEESAVDCEQVVQQLTEIVSSIDARSR